MSVFRSPVSRDSTSTRSVLHDPSRAPNRTSLPPGRTSGPCNGPLAFFRAWADQKLWVFLPLQRFAHIPLRKLRSVKRMVSSGPQWDPYTPGLSQRVSGGPPRSETFFSFPSSASQSPPIGRPERRKALVRSPCPQSVWLPSPPFLGGRADAFPPVRQRIRASSHPAKWQRRN